MRWRQFVPCDDGSWILNLPPYYASLFAACFPDLLEQTHAGFQQSHVGRTMYAIFPLLPTQEIQRIEGFLTFFERVVCLGLNRHLADAFSDELDFCLALDFTKPKPEADRTEIGELEFQAKYEQNSDAIGELQRELASAVQMLPPAAIRRPRLLTYVPCEAGRDFYLPARLTRGIVDMVPRTFWDGPDVLVTPVLTVAKWPAKRLDVAHKLGYWRLVQEAQGIQFSRSVKDCSVIVVDDLYQSGASLWSFARYLKNQGAVSVVGLACVKSLRDTDNR